MAGSTRPGAPTATVCGVPAPAVCQRRAHGGERLVDGLVGGVVRADRHGAFGAHPAEQVGDRDGGAVGTQIEADEVGPVGDDAVEPGVGSAPLRAALADDG